MFNKNRTHLKLGQLILLFRTIEQIKLKHDIAQTFFAGDFNLIPNSSLYEFIVNQKIDLNASVYEFSNQKMGIISELYDNEAQLISLNYKYKPQKYQPSRPLKNLSLFESIATIVPVLDLFGDEVIFCNIETLTTNILMHCYSLLFGNKIKSKHYYLKHKKKAHHVAKRKMVLAHILNCLSKKMNFKSSYSRVKSSKNKLYKKNNMFNTEIINENSFEKNTNSNKDALVTQFGEDIKGINLRFFLY